MRGWVLGVLVVAACADASRARDNDDDNSGSTSQTSAQSTSGAGGGATTTTSTSTGAGGQPVETPPYCQATCNGAADCAMGSAPYDADNYSCDSGTCTYLGCHSDTECQALGNYVCRASGPMMLCLAACANVADCNLGSPPFDTDNYSCQSGACTYLGCNSDSECQALGNYVCRDNGTTVKFCLPACTTPSNCDIGGGAAYDADNYSCDNGYCVYEGCNSDTECQSLGDYVCH